MKHLKKMIDDCNNEYLDPTILIDEVNDPEFKWYTLAKPICDVLNYYIENSPDAFGNAPYARLDGFMNGYLCGKGYTLEQSPDLWVVKKGKRTILTVEVPKKPQSYYDDLRDNAAVRRAVFGGF